MVMMNNKMMVALVEALSLWSYTPYAMAQNRARADIKNAQGSTVGTASLRETNDGLLVIVNVKGLPEGLHAVHIMRRGSVKVPPL
jgi:superoxide dismutase, Cu-Zn family